jgi:transposase
LTSNPNVFVGIAVDESKLEMSAHQRQEQWEFENGPEGIAKLIAVLRALNPRLVAVEAVGGRERAVVVEGCAAGLSMTVVDPTRVQRFAQGLGILTTTDRTDAWAIACFARVSHPLTIKIQDEQQEYLLELAGRRRQLIDMLTPERDRLHTGVPRSLPQAHLEWLNAELNRLDQEIDRLIRPEWMDVCDDLDRTG